MNTKITKRATKQLDRLSLIGFVNINNTHKGFYAQRHLVAWYCYLEIRVGKHQEKFPKEFSPKMYKKLSDAINYTYEETKKYIKKNKDLRKYWEGAKNDRT